MNMCRVCDRRAFWCVSRHGTSKIQKACRYHLNCVMTDMLRGAPDRVPVMVYPLFRVT